MDNNMLEILLRTRTVPVPDEGFAARIAERVLTARNKDKTWASVSILVARTLAGASPGFAVAASVAALVIGVLAGVRVGDFTDSALLDILSFDAVEDFLS